MCQRVVMPDGSVAIVCGRGTHKKRSKNMGLGKPKTNTSGGVSKHFELPTNEPHIACLVAIVDLGTQC